MDNKSIKQRLETLLKIQSIDVNLDNIEKMRGDLPEEVRELEDEIVGFQTRVDKVADQIKEFESAINDKRNTILKAKTAKKKYEEQQLEVRNNREYEALTKEIELQDLDIQVNEKEIKEVDVLIKEKQDGIKDITKELTERKKNVRLKRKELVALTKETKIEENKLKKERESVVEEADKRLYKSYKRLRTNVRNGLAIVSIKRNACGGCFNLVPPQKQTEIKDYKKILTCEYCGRILGNVEEVEEIEAPKRIRSRRASRTTA